MTAFSFLLPPPVLLNARFHVHVEATGSAFLCVFCRPVVSANFVDHGFCIIVLSKTDAGR